MDIIAGVNGRIQNLAAATEEISASSTMVVSTADQVKTLLNNLKSE